MGASAPAQVRALFVKSAVYQRRNTATNLCLVIAPVFFCVLLLVLQILSNKLILTRRDNNCGCQCTSCCMPVRVQQPWTDEEQARIAEGEKVKPRYRVVQQCAPLESGYCERYRNATCTSYNDSACSLRFSSPRQAIFCPIPEPSTWPAIVQTPRMANRAGGATTQWLPFTGTNMTSARLVAANLATAPELPNLEALVDLFVSNPLAVLGMRPQRLLELLLPVMAPDGLIKQGGEAVDAAQLSRLGLRFGSALRSSDSYYVEQAFLNSNSNSSRLQFLVPAGECASTGISNVTNYVALPMPEMVLRYYNATYPLIVAPLLQLLNVTPTKLSASMADSPLGDPTTACVDLLPREANNVTHLHRRLYCGFGAARCDGTYFIREYGGAWDFAELGPTKMEYGVFYNISLPSDDGSNVYRMNELMNMAVQAWTKTYWGRLPVVYRVRNRLLGLMSFPKLEFKLKFDFSIILGPLFYTWVIQMLMPSLLQLLVYEKEKRLRMMMKMHGLGDGAYWLVTYLWYLMLYVVYMIFFVVFGSIIGLKIFTFNSYTVQAVLYFVFGNNMIAFMLMVSSFFNSSRTATVAAFLYIFASGLIGELLLRTLMQEQRAYILVVQLVPGFALYRGLMEFSEYSIRAILADMDGLRWSNLLDPGNGMIGVWVILAAEWPVFMMLGWYFEQISNSGTGVRQHPLFFLSWLWRKPDSDLAALQSASKLEGGRSHLSASKPAPTASSSSSGSGCPPTLHPVADGEAGGPEGPTGPGGVAGKAKVPVAEAAEGSEPAAERGTPRQDPGAGSEGGSGTGRTALLESGRSDGVAAGPPPELTEGASGSSRIGCALVATEHAKAGAATEAAGLPTVIATASSAPADGARKRSLSLPRRASGHSSRSPVRGASPVRSTPSNVVVPHSPSRDTSAGGAAAAATGSSGGGVPSRSCSGETKILIRPASPAKPRPADAAAAVPAVEAATPAPAETAVAVTASSGPAQPGSAPRAGSAGRSGGGSSSSGSSRHASGAGAAACGGLPPRSPGSGRLPGPTAVEVALGIDAFDVRDEAARVAALDEEQLAAAPIVVRNLAKVFPWSDKMGGGGGRSGGGGWLRGCCGRNRGRVAVRTLTLAIDRGECFGLLGPNGAGKTTTINMLTGFLEPTAGDALVEGRSVRTRMPEIYRLMGVCPQENLLWEQLTGEEHLLFYGRLKGLKGKELTDAVDAAIRSVKLHINNAGKRRVGAYSGGMKRRLSVAISFIGNPQVVYLDEPSTGLDPASRRALWDVVREHKEGRAIILTTHSMEEAEILCDRLGIFVDGQLVCIGNPREITSRHASYLVFTLTVGPGDEDAAQAFVKAMCPDSRLTYALGSTFKYELPTMDVTLSSVFDAMSAAKSQMQVLDWGVANATLEEVFIKFARQIGAETRET